MESKHLAEIHDIANNSEVNNPKPQGEINTVMSSDHSLHMAVHFMCVVLASRSDS